MTLQNVGTEVRIVHYVWISLFLPEELLSAWATPVHALNLNKGADEEKGYF